MTIREYKLIEKIKSNNSNFKALKEKYDDYVNDYIIVDKKTNDEWYWVVYMII